MRTPIFQRFPAHLHTAQPLSLHLPHRFDHVPSDVLGDIDLRSRCDGRIGPAAYEQVREAVDGKRQVRRGRRRVGIAPALAERLPAPSDHAERVPEGGVEARRADQHVQRVLTPVAQLDACWRDPRDFGRFERRLGGDGQGAGRENSG